MANQFPPDLQPEPDDLLKNRSQRGPESAGQSGDSQGLSSTAGSSEESVEGLAEEGQSLEADVISGVEDAADHPEQPVRSHEDTRWVDRDPSER